MVYSFRTDLLATRLLKSAKGARVNLLMASMQMTSTPMTDFSHTAFQVEFKEFKIDRKDKGCLAS